jgi:hypothetical protein
MTSPAVVTHSYWLNLYTGHVGAHNTRELAEKYASPGRAGVVRVDFENDRLVAVVTEPLDVNEANQPTEKQPMSGIITREACRDALVEDLAWLEKQPRTLERDHIIDIVRNSVDRYYGEPPIAQPEAEVKAEVEATPFYDRTLDSFADDIIVRTICTKKGLYYGVLNKPPVTYIAEDFATYRSTEAQAIADCAKKIRNDHLGIGKYAPHPCLRDGYTLRFELMKYWAEQEQLSPQVALTDRMMGILQHASGWGSEQPGYRNHFCVSIGSPDHLECVMLSAARLMDAGPKINGDRSQYFYVNAAGGRALGMSPYAIRLMTKPGGPG